MELERLVMAELENMDLNGVRIQNLTCRGEATDVSFEVGDMKIDFTTTGGNNFQTLALTLGGTVYTDAATLSKCDDWVKYVITVVNPIIEKHRAEMERQRAEMERQRTEQLAIPANVGIDELQGPSLTNEFQNPALNEFQNPAVNEFQNPAVMNQPTQPIVGQPIASQPVAAQPVISSPVAAQPVINTPVAAQPAISPPATTTSFDDFKPQKIDDTQGMTDLDEIIDKGRKEGYKAARKKNIQEVKKLKRKHRLMTAFIVIVLVVIGLALLYFYQNEDIYLPDLPYIFG